MKRGLAFICLLVLGLGLVNAFEVNDISCNVLKLAEDGYLGQEIPSGIPYQDEIFNVYISESEFGYLEIQEGKIKTLECFSNENRTYDIFIKDYETLTSFMGEDVDALKIFNQKLKSGDIEIKGATVGKKMKLFFSKIGLKIFGWFR